MLGVRDLAMQALPLILNANAASVQKAIAILDRAITMDPAHAVGVALLAFSQIELANRCATATARNGLGRRSAPLATRSPTG